MGGVGNAPAPATYYNDPRFYPVPTKPVFWPRMDPRMAMADRMYPAGPRGNGVEPRPDATGPSLPEPEVLPLPAPTRLDERPRNSSRSGDVRGDPSWVFTPLGSSPTKGSDSLAVQAKPMEKREAGSVNR